jgi:hypothetical protein
MRKPPGAQLQQQQQQQRGTLAARIRTKGMRTQTVQTMERMQTKHAMTVVELNVCCNQSGAARLAAVTVAGCTEALFLQICPGVYI